MTSTLPISDEENNLNDEYLSIDKMYGEVQELKRVARQVILIYLLNKFPNCLKIIQFKCPFSSMAGTFLGGGGGANGQPPDLTQMVQIARRLLDTFDGMNAAGAGAGGVGGGDVESNALARLRSRRRF